MDFAVQVDHRMKIRKERRVFRPCWSTKKLWNIKVTSIPIVIDTLGTIPKVLVKVLDELEIGGRTETTKTTALLRSTRIPRRVLDTRGDLLSFRLQ